MTDAVIIAAITAIGGIMTAYIKITGDRRESFIKKELTEKSTTLDEMAKQSRIQNEFNNEMMKALSRIEQKVEDAPRLAGLSVGAAVATIEHNVSELDKKVNLVVTGIAVLQASKGN